MKCVILQPSYVPWRGYFHQIYKADVFVFLDDVQYDKHGWRNRNRVKSPGGTVWLTIPVFNKGNVLNATPIKDVRVCWDREWNINHWGTLKQSYGKAPHFREYESILRPFYESHPEFLADFTVDLSIAIANLLGIDKTRFVRSSTIGAGHSKTDRLLAILEAVNAKHYITGPSAKDYLEEDKLLEVGITLEYMVYDYPRYEQLYPPYDPQVSILDLLFMMGREASKYIW